MSGLLSFTWLLLRRNVLHHPRVLTRYTTGFPSRALHSAISSGPIRKSVYASVNYKTMSGQSRLLHFKSVQNNPVNKRENQVTPTSKQQTVKELLDKYISSRDTGNSLDPIAVLENIAISTERSAKQSLVLLNEPTLQNHYVALLNDINKSIELSNDFILNIIIILKAIGTISRRQKLFINKSGIDIYPNERSKTNETLLPEDGRILFDNIQNAILKNDLSGLQKKDLVTVLLSFIEAKQGSVELFNKLKKAILSQEIKEYTSEEISQIVHCYAKLKSSIDSWELFKSMGDEILRRGFVTFMSSDIPPILLGFADADQGKPDLYKAIIKDILSRDIRVFSSPELCQILWSFSKVKEKYSPLNLSDLLNRIEKEFLRRGIKRLDDRGLAVLLWSLLEMNYFSKKLFVLLRNVALKRDVRKLNPDDIATLLRCFAKVKTKINSNPLFAIVDKELVHRGFSGFNDSELATTIWAFVEMGIGSNALVILFKKELFTRNIKDFSAVNLSQIIWGLAKLREKIDMQDLFEFLGNEIVDNYDVTKLGVRQLALLAWSFAATNVTPKDLFTVIRGELSKRDLSDCSNTALCQILYAFAVVRDVNVGDLIKLIERKILRIQLNTFDNRQLALLVWSLGELRDNVQSTQVFEILEKEVSMRPLKDYMLADICRILWGFSKIKSMLNTAVVFNILRKELLRRGLGEFTVAQITMTTVALTKANEWHEDTYNLIRDEILSRNSRNFSAIHLCSLARSFNDMSFDTTDLFLWIGEEVISRGISAFDPDDLLATLQVLAAQNLPQKLHFFENVKKQLMESGENEYNTTDISRLSSLLLAAGVDTSDLEL